MKGLRSNLERSKVNTGQERDMNMVHRRDKEQGKGHKRVPDMAKDMVPETVMDTNKEHRLDMASGRRKMSGMTPASDPMRYNPLTVRRLVERCLSNNRWYFQWYFPEIR